MGEADFQVKKISNKDSYLTSIILGLFFGIIGSLIWFGAVILTEYQIGFVAIGVGWLVGFGILLGSGKKKSNKLLAIGIIVSFLSILFGEYLIANYYLVQYLIEEGIISSFTLLNPFNVILVVFELIPEDPLTLLFWGIAVWFTYSYLKPPKIDKLKV